MAPSSTETRPWFETAFDSKYLRIYAHRTGEEAEAAAPHIQRLLGAQAGDRLVDLACGEGRYARAMAKRGLRVTGIDLSHDLLEEARERSPLLPGSPQYFRNDIRTLPFFNQFDLAISMFTSFGYFETEEEDLQVFRGAHRALVPGGRFLLDFLNAEHVRSSLVPEDEVARSSWRIVSRRWIEEAEPRDFVCKHVRAFDLQTGLLQIEYQERVRLYDGATIDSMLEAAGFALVGDPAGSLEGGAVDALASRYIRVAERPVK